MRTLYDTRSATLGALLVAAIATPALANTTSRETGKSEYPLQYSALDEENAYLFLNRYKIRGTMPEGEQTVTRNLSDSYFFCQTCRRALGFKPMLNSLPERNPRAAVSQFATITPLEPSASSPRTRL